VKVVFVRHSGTSVARWDDASCPSRNAPGRVLNRYTFGFFGFLPFGKLLAGAVAEHRGLPMAMMMLGGGIIAAAVGAMVVRR
jgi:hypothetical protein